MYATILRNLSLWRVIPNGSSFGKTRLVEAGRHKTKVERYKLCHSINVDIFIEMYIFFVSDEYEGVVRGKKFGSTIELKIGDSHESKNFYNGIGIELDVPAQLFESRTLVPARLISEITGLDVNWDSVNRNVIISSAKIEKVSLENAHSKVLQFYERYSSEESKDFLSGIDLTYSYRESVSTEEEYIFQLAEYVVYSINKYNGEVYECALYKGYDEKIMPDLYLNGESSPERIKEMYISQLYSLLGYRDVEYKGILEDANGKKYYHFTYYSYGDNESYVCTETGKIYGDHASRILYPIKVYEDSDIDSKYTDPKYFEFDKWTGTIIKYKANAPENVVIPKTIGGVAVTNIGAYAFAGMNSNGSSVTEFTPIKSVEIPEGVTTIGNNAFMASSVDSVRLPEGLVNIGRSAFMYNGLTSIELPKSLKNMGDSAFCFNGLTSVVIPEDMTYIPDDAFGTNRISTLTIPEGIVSIGNSAFQNNRLQSVNIPSSVSNIGRFAFSKNYISSVEVPYNASIGQYAFDSEVEINR